MRKSRKPIIAGVAVALVAALGIGGTIAWLTDKSGPVTNTFTAGDINITLVEMDSADEDADANNNSYKMVPGNEISKDPTVTVVDGSEDCYLFVQVKESNSVDKFLSYGIADGWIQLKDGQGNSVDGVYWRVVEATDTVKTFGVIGYSKTIGGGTEFVSNKVLVNPTVTKTDMESIDGKNADGTDNAEELANRPVLTFKAFAVQKANIANAYTAWEQVPVEERLA